MVQTSTFLGEREKNQYGNSSLENIEKNCNDYASINEIKLSFSNQILRVK